MHPYGQPPGVNGGMQQMQQQMGAMSMQGGVQPRGPPGGGMMTGNHQQPRPLGATPQQPMGQPRPMGGVPPQQMQPRPMGGLPPQQMQPRPMGGAPPQQQMQPPRPPMGGAAPAPPQMQPAPMGGAPPPQMQPRPMGGAPPPQQMQPPRPMGGGLAPQQMQQPRPLGGPPVGGGAPQQAQQSRPTGGAPTGFAPPQQMQPRPMGGPGPQGAPPQPMPQQYNAGAGPRPAGPPMPQQFNAGAGPRPAGPPMPQMPPGSAQRPGTAPVSSGGASMMPPGGFPPQGMQQPMQQAAPPRPGMVAQQRPGSAGPPVAGPPMAGRPPQAAHSFQQGPPQGPPMSFQQGGPSDMMQPPSMMQQPPHMMQQPSMMQPQPPNMMQPAVQLDLSANCDNRVMRTTFLQFPNSQSLFQQSALPAAVVCQPLASPENGQAVPVVNLGAAGIVRCRSCRAYINPFVRWVENGRRWLCNFCRRDNETGATYYCHLDGSGQRADRLERPELSQGCFEFIATQEYMVRPPQAPVYVFVLDVSQDAVKSGMLSCAVDSIRRCLDALPGSPRTQVALLTFDYAVHFYSLNAKLSQPKMHVVSDVDDLFLPCPEDLLVNLSDSRNTLEMTLDALPRLHGKNATHEVASGSALMAAYRVMIHIGGKIMLFATKLPSLGMGKLKGRENPRALGTDKEHLLLQADGLYYQTEGSEMNKNNTSVELFMSPDRYCDLASLAKMVKTTGGQLHFYPRFTASVNGGQLRADIERSLKRETCWEAVVRLRASQGVGIKSFAGNFIIRANDLLQVPNCDEDTVFATELYYNDPAAVIQGEFLSLQGALLYTSSQGERRIRVMTKVLPLATNLATVMNEADQETISAFICKKAAEEAEFIGLVEVRSKMLNFCVNMLRSCRQLKTAGGYGQMRPGMMGGPGTNPQQDMDQPPPSLALLPLLSMAMQKNPAFRGGDQVSLDERIAFLQGMTRAPVNVIIDSLLPSMLELDTMPPDCGRSVAMLQGETAEQLLAEGMQRVGSAEKVKLPPRVPLSAQSLRSNGVFLVDNGFQLFMWVGHGTHPQLLQQLFGVASLAQVDAADLRVELGSGDSDLKKRVCKIVEALRAKNYGGPFKQLSVIKEGDPAEIKFRMCLVEDRAQFTGGSFDTGEYISHCLRLSKSAAVQN